MRTCIGCRRRTSQDDLVRLSVRVDGDRAVVERDVARRAEGRGAWVHDAPECLARLSKPGLLSRSFRIPAGVRAELAPDLAGNPTGTRPM